MNHATISCRRFTQLLGIALGAISLSAGAQMPLAREASPDDGYLAPAPWLNHDAPPPFVPYFGREAVVPVPPIDTFDINAVVAAYNTYYNIAMPAVGFTGSAASCNPGAISLAFQEWTISRINYLRAMAGVPGNTALNSALDGQQQAAALIMAANNTLTHSPPSNLLCWTQAGYNGASSSNLARGGFTDSIPLYMSDFGSGNESAGHRRWILHSRKGNFGLGQASGGTNANALHVFDSSGAASGSAGIPWPPRGYVPLALFPSSLRWSFGLPGANFAAANVTMTVNGSPLTAAVISRTDNGYGDNTLVWSLPTGHVVTKGSIYDVSITGVTGGASSTYNYSVRPIDPADVVVPTSAASRKTHGGAGVFDIDLPLTSVGVECRTGGTTRDYTIVVSFLANVSVAGTPQAAVTSGSGTIGSGGISNGGAVVANGNVVTIPLTNVADAQTLQVTLSAVNGTSNVTIPMSVLVGDVNAGRSVTATDIGLVKSQSGQTAGQSNFRADVNANGSINATDVSLVKSRSGNVLP